MRRFEQQRAILALRDVVRTYEMGAEKVHALSGVSLDIERNAFSRGLPEHGIELAEDLERLCQLHDGSNIAAVIVEPVQGVAGAYDLSHEFIAALRDCTRRHGVLLIADEVQSGMGRSGCFLILRHRI